MDERDLELARTKGVAFADQATQTLASTVLTPEAREASAERTGWDPGAVILGEYEVVKTLGSGGMGRVYLVRNQLSGQKFAVKSAHVDDSDTRRRFLRELRTWLELPEHPNLTACRFYRTVDGRVVIFADYVSGGTLIDGMRRGLIEDAEQVVDLAIQVARGLRVAHSRDLIHRDVKPGNILMTRDGEAKVTDFGLAGGTDLAVAGLTPAYCSPEQAFRDQPIRFGTDVWSWAATVLQMFTRKIDWPNGALIGLHLSRIAGQDNPIPIPAEIESLLGVCFSSSVDERPEFDAIIRRLEMIYGSMTGEDYQRADTVIEQTTGGRRVAATDTSWVSPRAWFEKQDSRMETGRVDAISDLGMFEEALEERRARLEENDSPRLREEMARLLTDKAKVHRHGGDFPGALEALEEARSLLPEGLEHVLAMVLTVQGVVLIGLTRYQEARETLVEALALRERLEGPLNELEMVEIRRQIARTEFFQRDFEASAERAEAALRGLDELGGVEELDGLAVRRVRALTLSTLATAQSKLDTETARDTLRQAVRLGEDLVVLDGCHDFREDLAKAYFNLAVCDRKLGDVDSAIETYGRVARLQEQLVDTEDRDDLVDDLAMTHSNLSFAHRFAGQLDEARHHAERAIGLRERLVHLRGRRDLRDRLAASYVARSYVGAEAQQWDEAVQFAELAASLRDYLVTEEERHDLEERLAGLHGSMGSWRQKQDRREEAAEHFRRAIDVRRRRMERGDDVKVAMLVESNLRLASCTEDPEEAESAVDRAAALLAEHEDLEMTEEGAALLDEFGLG